MTVGRVRARRGLRPEPLPTSRWHCAPHSIRASATQGSDVGTIGVVGRHEAAEGRCSLCGRTSEAATDDELGAWIVQDHGVLVCSICSGNELAIHGPPGFGASERVEKVPASAMDRLEEPASAVDEGLTSTM